MKRVLGCAVLLLALSGVLVGARVARTSQDDDSTRVTDTTAQEVTQLQSSSSAASGTAPPGTTQPILIGTAVAFAPHLETPAYAFTIAANTPYEGRLTIRSQPRPGNEGGGPVIGTARVRVFTILDAHRLLPLGENASPEITLRTTQETSSQFSITLPPLASGRHCLVVAVLEDPAMTVGWPAIDHASVGVVDISTTSPGADHCRGQGAGGETASVVDLPFACGKPVLSSERNRALSAARLNGRKEAWLLVSSCPDSETTTTLFIHNGRPIVNGSLSPFSMPSDGRVRAVKVNPLPRGSLRLLLIAPNKTGMYSEGFAGRPLLIE